MVNRKKMSDLSFGLKKEKEVLKLLKSRYKEKTINQNSKYSTFDFETEDGSMQWELKSRRIKSTTYPTMNYLAMQLQAWPLPHRLACQIYAWSSGH